MCFVSIQTGTSLYFLSSLNPNTKSKTQVKNVETAGEGATLFLLKKKKKEPRIWSIL